MARAILVIDVQKIYTDPASPLHCAENAEAIAVEKSENAIQRRSNITSATNGGGIRHASLPMQAVELRPASRARDTSRCIAMAS
ncbi:hypothetical protein ACN2CC_05680 [Mesorhizobium muleiense]|uniref:hypothetical protein n=1 Tax=Mesorhizobium muleiense TaxID=1004279 RepID=UPI003AFA618E